MEDINEKLLRFELYYRMEGGRDIIESLGRRMSKTNDTLMTPEPKKTVEAKQEKAEKPKDLCFH